MYTHITLYVRACVFVDNLEPFDVWCFNSQNINYMSSKTKALLIIFELNLIEIVYGTTQRFVHVIQ